MLVDPGSNTGHPVVGVVSDFHQFGAFFKTHWYKMVSITSNRTIIMQILKHLAVAGQWGCSDIGMLQEYAHHFIITSTFDTQGCKDMPQTITAVTFTSSCCKNSKY